MILNEIRIHYNNKCFDLIWALYFNSEQIVNYYFRVSG